MMRFSRLVALAVLGCLLAAAPAHALTKRQVFGIGNTNEFSATKLKALKPTATRIITPWNVAWQHGYVRDRIDAWYDNAIAAGLDPLLSFQGTSDGRVPSTARFEAAFRAALRRWPRVGEWQTWNEGNHPSQTVTWKHPKRAARYAKVMEMACPRCTVLPFTIVLSNQAPTALWIKRFLQAYGKTPKIWAVHDYGDVNRGGMSRMQTFVKAHPTGRIWVTETGAFAKFSDTWPYNLARQKHYTPLVFKSALRFRSRVDRLYWWEWRGQSRPRTANWDTGLVDSLGRPRPAYYAALKARFRSR
jgi:hypothetical protein